jgi:hypothetical protein
LDLVRHQLSRQSFFEQARISEPSIDTSLGLTGYQFSNAISISSAGYVLKYTGGYTIGRKDVLLGII